MRATNQRLNVCESIGPGSGGQIEILIAWHERILQTCHYPVGPMVTIGSQAHINLPLGTMVRNFNLIENHNGQAYVNLPFESKNFLHKNNLQSQIKEHTYRLQQNEVVFIAFGNNINLAVRFAPLTETAALSPMLFSSAEYTAMLCALVLTTLFSFIMSVMSPKLKKKEEAVVRVAQFIIEPPRFKVPDPIPEIPKPLPVVKPDQVTKQIVKQTAKQKPKMQRADSAETGLVALLNKNSIKQKLDKAFNSSADVMEIGENAVGTSHESNSDTDLGSKLKNTGTGGSGAATIGIADTRPHQNGLGKTSEFGVKEKTGIVTIGADADFIGTIDREAVRRAVKSHLHAIKYCYEREYKKDTYLEGKVVIAWEIHNQGLAKNVRVMNSQSTINNQIVEQCVRSVIETIRFPEGPAGAVVEVTGFPFVFSGNK